MWLVSFFDESIKQNVTGIVNFFVQNPEIFPDRVNCRFRQLSGLPEQLVIFAH
jgi:hypothetical protein